MVVVARYSGVRQRGFAPFALGWILVSKGILTDALLAPLIGCVSASFPFAVILSFRRGHLQSTHIFETSRGE
jgi:hypothetical protein